MMTTPKTKITMMSLPLFSHLFPSPGFFVFVTSNYRLKPTHKARLISPPMQPHTRTSCVVFWYHMYGRDVETLNIYVRSIDGTLGNPKWTLSGDQGNYWHRQTFDIAASIADSEVRLHKDTRADPVYFRGA